MANIDDIRQWITANESFLSGIAALVALAGLILSPIGMAVRRMLAVHGQSEPALASVVVIAGGRCHRKSRAVLEIARRLDGPWPMLYAFRLVPAPIADWIYDFVGARRYAWFGKREKCWLPDPPAER